MTRADSVADVTIEKFLRPFLRPPQRLRDLKCRVDLQGARIFFPEERPEELNRELRARWSAAAEHAG